MQVMVKGKRGQDFSGMDSIKVGAIIIVFVAVALMLGGKITNKIYDMEVDAGEVAVSTESPGGTKGVDESLNQVRLVSGTDKLFNLTAPSGNYNLSRNVDYTLTYANGILNVTNATYVNANLRINYSYNVDVLTSSANVTLSSARSLDAYAGFLAIIALLVVAIMIIAFIQKNL